MFCLIIYKYSENQPVGEPTSADSDALKNTVTSELVHHQGGVQEPRGLVVVGNNAADEVRISCIQCC